MTETKLIRYPWTEFLEKNNRFKLFGYGSLINQYSSQETIKGSLELIPAIGFGIKRVMNYDPDNTIRSRPIYQDPKRGDEYFGVFNIVFTDKNEDKANGVLREVLKSDYKNFVAREVGYSLVKITCSHFDKSEENTIEAYTLVAPEVFNGRKLINNELLPNVPYYMICREGAANISEEFLNVWLDTSFLGDGRTVREWEIEEGL